MISLKTIRGSMLGSAIGDALGAPTEFANTVQIRRQYGPSGIQDLQPAYGGVGLYTDDTQMALALAFGLASAQRPLVLEDAMEAIARAFGSWYRLQSVPGQSRAPGGTCMRSCSRLAAGVPWRSAATPRPEPPALDLVPSPEPMQSKGNGTVMRAHPIALALQPNPAMLASYAKAQARMTHDHPAAWQSAVAWVRLVADVAADAPDPEAGFRRLVDTAGGDLQAACRRAVGLLPELQRLIASEHQHDPTEDPWPLVSLIDRVGGCWTADEAVAAAWLIWRMELGFAESLIVAANIGGDSDTLACMVGALMGAANPDDVLTCSWGFELEGRALIDGAAYALHTLNDFATASRGW